MNLSYTDYFKKRLKKKFEKNSKLKGKVSKQLRFLQSDIHHPSLKTHKLKGDRKSEYAIWIEGDVRITFVVIKDGLLLTDIISHDEY
jgi:addiction module RelE/StbE family toxin